MRRVLSEKNLVVILFIMVVVTFSLAQEDTKKIEKMYQNSNPSSASSRNETLTAEAGVKAKGTSNGIPAEQLR